MILFFGCFLISFAQKENNIWYFGKSAGLDFNQNPPTEITSPMKANESAATMSDKNGNLLFYSDGEKVWDSTHVLMPNGGNLSPANLSNTTCQGVLIVQQPGSSNLYYIFSNSFGSFNWYYSIVDMSLNGGKGDVVVGSTQLIGSASEKLVAISHKHCGVWIVVLQGYPCSNFESNHLGTTGFNSTPVLSPGPGETHQFGYLKPSPNGKKIVSCGAGSNSSVLYDFDNATGKK